MHGQDIMVMKVATLSKCRGCIKTALSDSRAQPQIFLEAKKGAGNPILSRKSGGPECNLCTDPPVYKQGILTGFATS